MTDREYLEFGSIKALAAENITPEELFKIDQNVATGDDWMMALVGILEEVLGQWIIDHQDVAAHPGRHLVPVEYLELVTKLSEDQAKGLLMLASWRMAEQRISDALEVPGSLRRMQILLCECDDPDRCPNCREDGWTYGH